eukprot:1331460-Amorphochlora_amoeboformis.AAC.1
MVDRGSCSTGFCLIGVPPVCERIEDIMFSSSEFGSDCTPTTVKSMTSIGLLGRFRDRTVLAEYDC